MDTPLPSSHPASLAKETVVNIFAIVLAILAFLCLKAAPTNYYFLIPFALLLPFGWALVGLLVNRWAHAVLGGIIISLTTLMVIPFSWYGLIAIGVLAIMLIAGYFRAHKEKVLRIKVAVEDSVYHAISRALLGLSFVLAIFVYTLPAVQQLKSHVTLPPWAKDEIVRYVMPQFDQNITLREATNILSRKEKDAPLPESEFQVMLDQAGLADLHLNGSDILQDHPEVITNLVEMFLNNSLKNILPYLPFLLALTVWEAFIIVAKILVYVVAFLTYLTYLVLKSARFIKVETSQVEQEIIKL